MNMTSFTNTFNCFNNNKKRMVGKQKIRDKCENGHLKNNETAARGPTDVEQHTKKRGRGVETNR